MERETPTVPETSTQIDVKLAAIGVVSGIVAAMAMDALARGFDAMSGNRTGRKPSRETQRWLGTFAHYGFGAAMGVNYMLASEQAPDLRRGYGTVYGSLMWAAADEVTVPAAGLSKKPSEIPLGVHAFALGSHWVYGAVLETCRRIAATVLTAPDGPDRAQ